MLLQKAPHLPAGPKENSNVLSLRRLTRRRRDSDPALQKRQKVRVLLHLTSLKGNNIIAVQAVGGKRVCKKKTQVKSVTSESTESLPTHKQHHDKTAHKAVAGKFIIAYSSIVFDSSFTVSSTRRTLHIINSDNENDEDVDEQQPSTRESEMIDSEDDFAKDEDDGSEDDDGLQHLHASQVGAMLQKEVKIETRRIQYFAHNDYISKPRGESHSLDMI